MKKLTQILQDRRQSLQIKLSKISQDTKIPQEQLNNLEQGNLTNFGSYAYLQGVVKKYAEYLGLNPELMASYLRREIEQQQVKFIRVTDYQNNSRLFSLNWSIYIIVSLVVLFFILQLFLSWQKPLLELRALPKTITVSQPLVIRGQTEPGVLLYLNDEQIYQNEKGFFSKNLYFKTPGERRLIIKAIGVNGKEQIEEFIVNITSH